MDDDLLHELHFVDGKEYKAHAMELERAEKRVDSKTSTNGVESQSRHGLSGARSPGEGENAATTPGNASDCWGNCFRPHSTPQTNTLVAQPTTYPRQTARYARQVHTNSMRESLGTDWY